MTDTDVINTILIFAGLTPAIVGITTFFNKLVNRLTVIEEKLKNSNPTISHNSKDPVENANDILERRLVSGEITEEQFKNMKKLLKKK